MPIKYVPYYPETIEGQAILNNVTRTQRVLRYRDNNKVYDHIRRGMPYYELEKIERVGNNSENMLIRGECISACAYLKDKGIKIDLVYIDPPFASGADYAKKIYLRRNPKLAEKIAKAEEELDIEEFRIFEEKMYGDIWNKEDYLNWMYENLMAIKSVMSEIGSIYVHLDWHIGHYVKVLMDEVFGEDNFRNEIVWCYTGPSRQTNDFPDKHDVIYRYSRSESYIFNFEKIKIPYVKLNTGKTRGIFKGEATLSEEGKIPEDWWSDITPVARLHATELLNYQTQKPEALLERIIKASSNESMIVADFFGGSGVTAKVANDLNRKFIHVDVGINSIQTTRDRLIATGAEFDIYDIKDGVSLFRNPIQTMDKLKSLIKGLNAEPTLDSFWIGAINDSKIGLVPVYVPNLLDNGTKVLDIPMINSIINRAVPDLPDGIKKVIIYYVDIENDKDLNKFIKDYSNPNIKIELQDLKEILDEAIINDQVYYELKKISNGFEIEFKSFISDRLIQNIDAYNQKKLLNSSISNLFNESFEGDGENGDVTKNKKPFKPIEISESGLELIELISLDCSNFSGVWKSDIELKIDKNGFIILNGKKTKELWNGKIISDKKPLRMKVRNIAGDESIIIF
jgi:adenine-specific DNA-methyltransferase